MFDILSQFVKKAVTCQLVGHKLSNFFCKKENAAGRRNLGMHCKKVCASDSGSIFSEKYIKYLGEGVRRATYSVVIQTSRELPRHCQPPPALVEEGELQLFRGSRSGIPCSCDTYTRVKLVCWFEWPQQHSPKCKGGLLICGVVVLIDLGVF